MIGGFFIKDLENIREYFDDNSMEGGEIMMKNFKKTLSLFLVFSLFVWSPVVSLAGHKGDDAKKITNPCNPCGKMMENVCNPCGKKMKNACNPCNPCGKKMMNACNPCNPCGKIMKNACNPCNPCGKKMKNACNPCNPCGKK